MKHQNSEQPESIRPAFEVNAIPDNTRSQEHQDVRPSIQLDEAVLWNEDQVGQETDYETDEVKVEDKHARFGSKWLWLGIFVMTLSTIELVIFIDYMLNQGDWLSGAWLFVIFVIVYFGIRQVFKEWRSLRKLKKREQTKQVVFAIQSTPSIGQGESYCQLLAEDLADQYQTNIDVWKKQIQPHHVDSEIVNLFELQVLKPADEKALKCITQHASASAAMIAVSPFALLDMAVVLWRNLRMLKQVSECYGIELSYWGRISLVKRVFKTMLVAGAAEIISDAGNYALGAGMTGKLSSRLAQGLGAGVLTSRVGVKAMQACRPLPWTALKQPGLTNLANQIASDLKSIIK